MAPTQKRLGKRFINLIEISKACSLREIQFELSGDCPGRSILRKY